jgi:biotin carboxyl carrier protein
MLTAPHVGTLRSIATAGDYLRAGEAYAVVEVLDEGEALVAMGEGVVIETLARQGDLVEHDQPLLSVRAALVLRSDEPLSTR